MMADFTDLKLEQHQPGIWLLTIDRPKALNALNVSLLQSLSQALTWLEQQTVNVLLLTGAGEKAFVAGADIAAMHAMSALEARNFSQLGMQVMHRIEQFPAPVIALVNGYCLGGGCELAMSCDYIVASDKAVFGQPEVSLGIPPGFGGTQRLTRLIGKGHAMRLILTGDLIQADEALRINLCQHVVSLEHLFDVGLAHANKISKNAPQAVRFAKELIKTGLDLDIQHGCQIETELFALSFTTQDQIEGMSAFIEHRQATFTDNAHSTPLRGTQDE